MINQGTIIADAPGGSFLYINTSSLVNDGVILAVSGANLAIQNLTNQAGRTISIHGGGTLTLTTVNNSGTISADSSILNINSGWMNNGVLSASNTTANFGGAFKLSDIGTFTRQGGTVNLTGTLDNTGSTLLVDSAFQGGVNLAGGTIKGGVIDATDANYVLRSTRGTLDNVTLNTDLVVADYKVLVVTNGLTLNAKLTLATSDYAYLKFRLFFKTGG